MARLAHWLRFPAPTLAMSLESLSVSLPTRGSAKLSSTYNGRFASDIYDGPGTTSYTPPGPPVWNGGSGGSTYTPPVCLSSNSGLPYESPEKFNLLYLARYHYGEANHNSS